MPAMQIMKRVMVACVTTEVIKITRPAHDTGVDRIHLLNFVKEGEANTPEEQDRKTFYENIYNQVKWELNQFVEEVVEHRDVTTYNFDQCFHSIYDILYEEKEQGSDIYVNISGGTPEYSAAAAIASMMVKGVKLFSVGTMASGFTVDFKKQLEQSYHEGHLVGSAFDVHEPFPIGSFPLPTPDEDLLKALKVFVSIQVGRRSNVNVIRKLINYGLWRFALDEGGTGTSVEFEDGDGRFIEGKDYEKYLKRQKKEAVLYQRGYIEKWKKLGWIEKSSINGKRYDLTETGKRYVEIFCSDVVFKIDSQNL
ncbi:HFX_2341 family transcriptional regulator domain-containing protein [Methanomethylophilus alvi]|uniref:HFX_2341 family transcriptional regulator domain-containing protein n=1 Tax=Methanomethylophilus alvi TaxID=1291540 RepID=UPI0037DCEBDE